jgi:hypothetical protein
MSHANDCLFLSLDEREAIAAAADPLPRFLSALSCRVAERLAYPGLLPPSVDVLWQHAIAEILSDAAMQFALRPDDAALAAWLRGATLDVCRRPAEEWSGPWFRDRDAQPLCGHLETAHICWGVATVIDLAHAIFSDAERQEILHALREKGLALCRRWLARNRHLANWRGIMSSGAIVAAAALDDQETLADLIPEWRLCAQAFQDDGSYGESLQYGNYLAYALMLAYESLARRFPSWAEQLDIGAYARGMHWICASMLYAKPMRGWGVEARARAVNFNDSGALFRPSGDLLLHVAARCATIMPKEAGLARWLFERYYAANPALGPHHLASFGFIPDWGFLTPALLAEAAPPLGPAEVELPEACAFDNGQAFLRDKWGGKTAVAIQAAGTPLNAPGHIHGDLNSFLLTHRQERLLIDPGHSCYRNLIHGLESSTQTHNTCTFLLRHDPLGLQEDLGKASLLEQTSILPRRLIENGVAQAPVSRGGRRLLLEKEGEIAIFAAEAGAAYGAPIEQFIRLWILVGENLLFLVDKIVAARPVTAVWNWLLNNRDGVSRIERATSHLSLWRGEAVLRLWPMIGATASGPVFAYAHDAYHPEPNRPGEGKPGSAWLFRYTEKQAVATRVATHLIVIDAPEAIDQWTARRAGTTLNCGKTELTWTLAVKEEAPLRLVLRGPGGLHRRIEEQPGGAFRLLWNRDSPA